MSHFIARDLCLPENVDLKTVHNSCEFHLVLSISDVDTVGR